MFVLTEPSDGDSLRDGPAISMGLLTTTRSDFSDESPTEKEDAIRSLFAGVPMLHGFPVFGSFRAQCAHLGLHICLAVHYVIMMCPPPKWLWTPFPWAVFGDPLAWVWLAFAPIFVVCNAAVMVVAYRLMHAAELRDVAAATLREGHVRRRTMADCWWRLANSVGWTAAYGVLGIFVWLLFPAWRSILLWYCAPFVLVAVWPAHCRHVEIAAVAALCYNEIDAYCADLHMSSGREVDEADQSPKWDRPSFWLGKLRLHQEMDARFEAVWRKTAPVIFAHVMACCSVGFLGVVTSVHIHKRSTRGWDLMFTIAALVNIGMVLHMFWPLAQLTEKCQSMRPGVQSIRALAAKHAGYAMSTEVRLEYDSYMAHLDRTPCGVEIPFLGAIDMAYLMRKLGLVVSVCPFLFTFSLGLFEPSGEHRQL